MPIIHEEQYNDKYYAHGCDDCNEYDNHDIQHDNDVVNDYDHDDGNHDDDNIVDNHDDDHRVNDHVTRIVMAMVHVTMRMTTIMVMM